MGHPKLQVTKYVMSEEDYASRDNTYRKYKEGKLREDPSWTLEKEMCMRRGAL
jgi:tubulin-folding cofactor B